MTGNFYEIIGSSLAKKNPVWGYHVIIDAKKCDKSTVLSEDTIKSFLKIMVDRLMMIPVGEPVCYNFDDGNGRGVSGLQLITTSHISCHTDNDGLDAYIDVFSCNNYSEQHVNIVINGVKEYFNPAFMATRVILREPGKITNV